MSEQQQPSDDELPIRGIYLIPNLFTITALFAGFYAVATAMAGRFDNAAIAIFIAMIMDSLDGRIARLTHTQTAFGAELDSLSDMVSFGVAPALVVYSWALMHIGKIGWLAAFVFTAAVALRLARFNIQQGTADKRFFTGLPCPAAAAIIAGFVWVGVDLGLTGKAVDITSGILSIATALLMVSNLPYRSFKDFDIKGKVPFIVILLLVFAYVLISIDPPEVLFAIFFAYGLSGPLAALWRLRPKKRHHHPKVRGRQKKLRDKSE